MGCSLNYSVKRIMDITGSLLAIIILSPIMGLVAVAIRIISGSPVIFRQMRPGLRGEPFMLYKFRTMSNEKGDDYDFLPDERRITPLGILLRNTSLDELPELINVLKGDMSMVGPRPLLMEYLPLYSAEQYRRHNVKPGITGWAQVNGRNALDWEERFRLDLWYVDHQSHLLDLKILMMTVVKVIRRDNISQNGEATMARYEGSVDR